MAVPRTLNWSELYGEWRSYWESLGEPSPVVAILDLPFVWHQPHPPTFVDWWPTVDVPENRRILEEWSTTRGQGTYILGETPWPWTSTKGTLHTAGMLLAAEDAEEVAAVWLAAALWDLVTWLQQDSSRVETWRLVDPTMDTIRRFLVERDFSIWHHQMRAALPYVGPRRYPRPTTEREVVVTACRSVSLVRAKWTVVASSEGTPRSRAGPTQSSAR